MREKISSEGADEVSDPKPDYMVEFDDSWRDLVTDEHGALDLDKVARELADYAVVMQEVSKVYDELTQGRYSKPNTLAAYVIERTQDLAAEDFAEQLLDAMDRIVDFDPNAAARAVIVDLANEWSPGALDRWEESKRQRDEAAAAREAAAPTVNAHPEHVRSTEHADGLKFAACSCGWKSDVGRDTYPEVAADWQAEHASEAGS